MTTLGHTHSDEVSSQQKSFARSTMGTSRPPANGTQENCRIRQTQSLQYCASLDQRPRFFHERVCRSRQKARQPGASRAVGQTRPGGTPYDPKIRIERHSPGLFVPTARSILVVVRQEAEQILQSKLDADKANKQKLPSESLLFAWQPQASPKHRSCCCERVSGPSHVSLGTYRE